MVYTVYANLDERLRESRRRDASSSVLVLGRPDILSSLSQVPVLPLSAQVRGLAWEVALTEADGVLSPCVIKPEWIRIVERAYLGPWITALPEGRWPEVRRAAAKGLVLPILSGQADELSVSKVFRDHLEAARVTRPDLFAASQTQIRIRLRSLRDIGITWRLWRGDNPFVVQRNAGHKRFSTTERSTSATSRS